MTDMIHVAEIGGTYAGTYTRTYTDTDGVEKPRECGHGFTFCDGPPPEPDAVWVDGAWVLVTPKQKAMKQLEQLDIAMVSALARAVEDLITHSGLSLDAKSPTKQIIAEKQRLRAIIKGV